MKNTLTDHYAAPEELRPGMFVHLEGGWFAHPFPLSNFKLVSPDQVATLRSLGLTKIRWSPGKSDPEPLAANLAPKDTITATERGTDEQALQSVATAQVDTPAAEQRHRSTLTAQREALQVCQQQYAEATLECKTLTDLVTNKPQLARERCEALSQAFVSKMLDQGESCIRLLGQASGNNASLHAVNVTVISLLLGKALGLDETEMLDLGVGAMLHDIGKLDLPERVRHRDEHLSSSELEYYEEHVAMGLAYGRKMGLSAGAALVIGQHHEHSDGSGFPHKLTSERMSIAARIVSLVNLYDNLCNPPLLSKALTPHEALALLFVQGKIKFDNTILGGFIKMMGVYPPGSVVQLIDNRYALVVSVNSSRPLKPGVLIQDPNVPREEAAVLDLETVPGLGILRSVKPTALPQDAFDYLSPQSRMAYFFEPARCFETVPLSDTTTP